jgi:hypothetical protein
MSYKINRQKMNSGGLEDKKKNYQVQQENEKM